MNFRLNIFISHTQEKFTKINHMLLDHKAVSTHFKVLNSYRMFSDLVEIKLEINKDNKNPKKPQCPDVRKLTERSLSGIEAMMCPEQSVFLTQFCVNEKGRRG